MKAYIQLLETVFFVQRLPAWRTGLGAREVGTPKLNLVDSGLLAYLLGADEGRLATDDQITGRVLENFVVMELIKLAQWARTDTRLYHYRDGRDEVDVVLEARSGDLIAVEVKASASLGASSWRGLAKFRDAVGARLKAGVVLYTGEQTLPLGERLWAVPVTALWTD